MLCYAMLCYTLYTTTLLYFTLLLFSNFQLLYLIIFFSSSLLYKLYTLISLSYTIHHTPYSTLLLYCSTLLYIFVFYSILSLCVCYIKYTILHDITLYLQYKYNTVVYYIQLLLHE